MICSVPFEKGVVHLIENYFYSDMFRNSSLESEKGISKRYLKRSDKSFVCGRSLCVDRAVVLGDKQCRDKVV